MKKVYLLGAMLLGASTTLVSCVDTNESASVEAVRNSKAEEQKALAALYNAQAAAATAQAQAEAALKQAEAALVQAQAEQAKAQAEYQKIMNEYQKDMNNLDLQIKLAQAELAKAKAEKAIQDIKNKMELAVIEHEKAIAQAKQDLKDLLASLAAENAENLSYYANLYVDALNEASNTESELLKEQLAIKQWKATNTLESALKKNEDNVADLVASYKSTIESYKIYLEKEKAELANNEERLKIYEECKECKDGDVDALRVKVDALQHELNHKYQDQYGNSDIAKEYKKAVDDAKDGLYNNAGDAKREAANEAYEAMTDDDLYKLSRTWLVDGYNVYAYWGSLGITTETNVEDYDNMYNHVIAKAEFTNSYGDKDVIEKSLGEYYRYYNPTNVQRTLHVSYDNWYSADQIRLAKEKLEKQYADRLKDVEERIGNYKWNAEQATTYAQRVEAMAKRDSVAVDGKACVDSVQIQWNATGDSLKIVEVDPFEIQGSEFTNYWSNFSYEKWYNNANNFSQNATELETKDYISWAEWNDETGKWVEYRSYTTKPAIIKEQAAYKKFVDLIDNADTYAAAYEKKVDTYFAAAEAYVKDFAQAEANLEAFNNGLNPEISKLQAEINTLELTIKAILNHQNALKQIEDAIASKEYIIEIYEANIEKFEKAIESAEADGKIKEEWIKETYDAYVALAESNLKVLEEKLAIKKAEVAAYKAILDQLVASEAE